MKPRAGQPQDRSPCPRAPARPHVRLSDTTRTGRAAEDVGPYHPSCPDAARRGTSPSGRVAIHCDRGRRASCRTTRSARRHEGTEEVESWFTRTSVMDCLIPRPGRPGRCRTPRAGAARILRAPGRQEVGDIGRRAFVADEVADEAARKPASKPFSVSPCLPVLRVNRPEAREEREAFHHVEQEYNPHAYAEYSSRRTGASHCWR